MRCAEVWLKPDNHTGASQDASGQISIVSPERTRGKTGVVWKCFGPEH
jgi:hypothetical protein